jgi:hypothetical protein
MPGVSRRQYDLQVLGQIQVLTVKNAEPYSPRLKNYEVGGLPCMAALPYASLTD